MPARLATWALPLALCLIGCKADEGERCEDSGDCKDGHACVRWGEVHEDLFGGCEAKRCCLSDLHEDDVELEEERRERDEDDDDDDEGLVSQCNRLIEVINREQGPLQDVQGSDPKALDGLADTLDGVAAKVRAVPVKDTKLVELRDDYAAMARDLAATSRETAAALRSTDVARAAKAAKEMQQFSARESKLVDAVNRLCSGTP